MKKIISIIQQGSLVVLKTDTLYGILGLAKNKDTVENIYHIKNREITKPFIILISHISQMKEFGIKINKKLIEILENYWPGPVSIILPVETEEFYYLHRGRKTLAFRFPDSDFLQKVINQTGPLVAPSANPEGLAPAKNIGEAITYFGGDIHLYQDGGVCEKNIPSKIISIKKDFTIEIIRK